MSPSRPLARSAGRRALGVSTCGRPSTASRRGSGRSAVEPGAYRHQRAGRCSRPTTSSSPRGSCGAPTCRTLSRHLQERRARAPSAGGLKPRHGSWGRTWSHDADDAGRPAWSRGSRHGAIVQEVVPPRSDLRIVVADGRSSAPSPRGAARRMADERRARRAALPSTPLAAMSSRSRPARRRPRSWASTCSRRRTAAHDPRGERRRRVHARVPPAGDVFRETALEIARARSSRSCAGRDPRPGV